MCYVIGHGNFRKLVIFDILLNSRTMSDDEIVALISRELGASEMSHKAKDVAFKCVEAACYLGLLYHILGEAHYERAFGFFYWKNENEHFIYLFLIGVMAEPYRFFTKLLKKYIKRCNVFAADAYAVEAGHAANLQTALIKLQKVIDDDLKADYMYAFLFHKRPVLMDRLHQIADHHKNLQEKNL